MVEENKTLEFIHNHSIVGLSNILDEPDLEPIHHLQLDTSTEQDQREHQHAIGLHHAQPLLDTFIDQPQRRQQHAIGLHHALLQLDTSTE